MIKHLFKMVWNRKRTNFLITVEIFFSFLVLFTVILFAVYYTDNYRQPLGFSYENLLNISITTRSTQTARTVPGEAGQPADHKEPSPSLIIARQLFLTLRDFNEIESFAGAGIPPYSTSTSITSYDLPVGTVEIYVNDATDSFADTVSLTVTRGRWFSKEDDGASYRPVVINERLTRIVFGNEDPIGRNLIRDARSSDGAVEPEHRVIGVITDFRKDGEFAGLQNYMFQRQNLDAPESAPPQHILVRVRPGTTAEFEATLMSRMLAVAKDWSFEIEPVTDAREERLKTNLAPIITGGLVAVFLMIMVALGLTGVLWQNVTQRTKEIGLRRAKGATAGNIYTQILGELLVITSFGLVIGIVVVVQFPLLDLIGFISNKVYIFSVVLSLLLIYGLTLLCGLYPSRLATRVQPAEALHYE
jgi:putative ABC transport system permease protein